MPTWKLTLEYDGAAFCGWQVQPNGRSVQAALETALGSLHSGDAIRATAAGRTDAGVHARGQVVSFSTPRELGQGAYLRGLNSLLPAQVAVVAAERAPVDFDARRWARGKEYEYRIVAGVARSPLREGRYWHLFKALDRDAMASAAAQLVGRHDFGAFRASDCDSTHAVRELTSIDVTASGPVLIVTVRGTAFLKHMVRNLVGTLVEVGQGRRAPQSMAALLASKDRTKAGRTAPAHGLYLNRVFYGEGPRGPADDGDE